MMASDPEGEPLKSVTFKLSRADIERLRQIVEWRYPEDRHMMAKVLRELIREEHARIGHDASTD